jgi:hypothetical protein
MIRRPQAKPVQSTPTSPCEYFVNQGTPDAAVTVFNLNPCTTDSTPISSLSIKHSVHGAEHVICFARQEHHIGSGFRHGTGELLPVGPGPRRRVSECFSERMGRIGERPQTQLPVEVDLMCDERPDVHEITDRANFGGVPGTLAMRPRASC